MTPDQYVVSDTGCWVWSRGKTKAGYGRIGNQYAHRLAYVKRHGRIPDELQIDHVCRNRACVNPDHLEAVTQQENIRRGAAAQQKCVKGHIYDHGNTMFDGKGYRRCRKCAHDTNVERAKERRAQRHTRELRCYIGHGLARIGDRQWECKCGERLAETRDAAVVAMRAHRQTLASADHRALAR